MNINSIINPPVSEKPEIKVNKSNSQKTNKETPIPVKHFLTIHADQQPLNRPAHHLIAQAPHSIQSNFIQPSSIQPSPTDEKWIFIKLIRECLNKPLFDIDLTEINSRKAGIKDERLKKIIQDCIECDESCYHINSNEHNKNVFSGLSIPIIQDKNNLNYLRISSFIGGSNQVVKLLIKYCLSQSYLLKDYVNLLKLSFEFKDKLRLNVFFTSMTNENQTTSYQPLVNWLPLSLYQILILTKNYDLLSGLTTIQIEHILSEKVPIFASTNKNPTFYDILYMAEQQKWENRIPLWSDFKKHLKLHHGTINLEKILSFSICFKVDSINNSEKTLEINSNEMNRLPIPNDLPAILPIDLSRLYDNLHNQFKRYWFSSNIIHTLLFDLLKDKQGRWEFEVAKSNQNDLLRPLIDFIIDDCQMKTNMISPAGLNIVKQVIDFMQFYCLSENPFLSPKKNIRKQERRRDQVCQAILDQCPKRQGQSGDLSSVQSSEINEIFLQAKLHELMLRLKTGKLKKDLENTLISIPCFIVSQDQKQVHIEVLRADMDEKHSLRAIGRHQDASIEALKNCSIQNIVQSPDRLEAYATSQAFKQLREEAKKHAMIILERTVFQKGKEEIEIPKLIDSVSKEKREREVEEQDENQKPKSKHPKTNLALFTETPKRKRSDFVEGSNLKTPTDLKLMGSYHELEEEKIRIPKVKKPKLSGIIYQPYAIHFESFNSEDKGCEDPAYLWSYLADLALKKVLNKVECEEAKFQVHVNEKPLTYPALPLIQNAKSLQTVFIPKLNRLLKEYQKEDLNQIHQYAEAGLSKLLCYEMGVGKTFVYGSALLNEVYQGLKSHGVVITPKNISATIYRDIVFIFQEGIFTAWEYLLQEERDKTIPQGIKRLTLSKLSIEDPETILGVMMLGRLTLAEIQAKISPKILLGLKNSILIKNLYDLVSQQLETKKQKCLSNVEKVTKVNEKIKELENFDSLTLEGKLQFLGQALAFNPDRDASASSFEKSQLENLLSFELKNIKCCSIKNEFTQTINEKNPSIIVGTYENFLLLPLDQIPPIQMIIFDEMQKLQNTKAQRSTDSKALMAKLKNSKKIGVTGTPLENRFDELLNLLSIVNPEVLEASSFKALSSLIQMAIEQLQAGDQDKALSACFKSYIHIAAFQKALLNDLIIRRTQEDVSVVRDWEGRVTHLNKVDVDLEITESEKQSHHSLVDQLQAKTLDNLGYQQKKNAFLLHADLFKLANEKQLSLTLENTHVKEFIKKIRELPETDLGQFISHSPLLRNLNSSSLLQDILTNKKKIIIFTSSLVIAKVAKEFLKRQGISNSKFYRSEGLTQEQKEEKIKWYKDGVLEHKVLISSYKSGGTGFSLPEADEVWLLDQDYNPGVIKQAIYRAKRVGTTKKVDVMSLKSSLFFSQHVEAILDNKENFFKFLFTNFDSHQEHFKIWLQYLVGLNYHAFLNNKKDMQTASECLATIQILADEISQKVTEDELKKGIEQVMPSAPLPPLPESLRIQFVATDILQPKFAPEVPENRILVKPIEQVSAANEFESKFASLSTASTAPVIQNQNKPVDLKSLKKFPVLEGSYDRAVWMGMLLFENPSANSDVQVKVKKLLDIYDKNPTYRAKARDKELSNQDPHLNQVSTLLEQLSDLPYLLKETMNQYKIEIYEQKKQEYSLKEIKNPDSLKTIKLLEISVIKNKKMTKGYDLLIQ